MEDETIHRKQRLVEELLHRVTLSGEDTDDDGDEIGELAAAFAGMVTTLKSKVITQILEGGST